jgi:hypothetical protein
MYELRIKGAGYNHEKDCASSLDVEFVCRFFVAHLLGSSGTYRAVLAGNKGTTLTVEFYGLNAARMSDVRGVAEDNNGNVFKLTF